MTMSNMADWPGGQSDPRMLKDAYARIDQAKLNMEILSAEISNLGKQTIEKMIGGWSEERNSFEINLPPAELAFEGRVPSSVQAKCSSIIEDMHAALDYGIMRVAEFVNPNMTKSERRRVQFIIAKDQSSFNAQMRSRLAFLGQDIKSWMELRQPYQGNEAIEFIGRMSGVSKHQNLPVVKHAPQSHIELRKDKDREVYEDRGWWIFPVDRGHMFVTRVLKSQLVIDEKYDALVVLPICIDYVESLVNDLEQYLRTVNPST
ncbi:MAG: hypothetical protein OXG33_15015 [Chloroflexi bacterium]|nr:hypothetical protein [Chloroflexota bacterium]